MEGNPKTAARRRARNITIASMVLLVLLVAAGVAYTWYMDQKPQKAASQVAQKLPAEEAIKPTAPKPGTQESAAIEYLSSPLAPGDSASINVKTVATSSCTISVTYNNVASADQGLKPKTADDFGNVNWNWTVAKNVPAGTWPVNVTCSWQGKSAVVQGSLVVAK